MKRFFFSHHLKMIYNYSFIFLYLNNPDLCSFEEKVPSDHYCDRRQAGTSTGDSTGRGTSHYGKTSTSANNSMP